MRPMPRRILLLVSAALFVACATSPRVSEGPVPVPAPRSRPHPPADIGVVRLLAGGGTLAAVSRDAVLDVHAAPGTERPYDHLEADNPWGQPLKLLVVGDALDGEGDVWLRIQMPIWPNGQAGWVAASDVRVAEARERVVVDLSARSLVRLREGTAGGQASGGRRLGGDPDTTRAVLRLGEGRDRPPLGPLRELHPRPVRLLRGDRAVDGVAGEPRLAIHGTDDPGHAGQAVSNGCIRVLNRLLRVLRDVPMGTPVVIRP